MKFSEQTGEYQKARVEKLNEEVKLLKIKNETLLANYVYVDDIIKMVQSYSEQFSSMLCSSINTILEEEALKKNIKKKEARSILNKIIDKINLSSKDASDSLKNDISEFQKLEKERFLKKK